MDLSESSVSVSTKTVGITKPTAVPTILMTDKNASARDLFIVSERYILRGKPSGSDFSGCIQDEWLGDSAKELAKNHVIERVVHKTPDAGADGCEH